MKISNFRICRANGGWRPFSFLKIETDAGVTGWSEFVEGAWSPAIDAVVSALFPSVSGEDPRHFAAISARLHARGQLAPGGLYHQAVAAIENACIDIAAKSRGMSVSELFGGPVRDRIRAYWSHFGTFGVAHPKLFESSTGRKGLRTESDFKRLGMEVQKRGFDAVKTNPIVFNDHGARLLNPGFLKDGLDLAKRASSSTIAAIARQMQIVREAVGPDVEVMLDVNFSMGPESVCRLVDALEPCRLMWLECDLHDPAALAKVRNRSTSPIASLESIYGRRGYKAYLEAMSVDVAVVDVPWNGFAEAVRIAAIAEAFDVPVAPHNFYGPLADLMSAHFCGVAPNAVIMELEADDVPWKQELLTAPAAIEDGALLVPVGAGWGAEVDEEAVRAHAWPE